jgi:hypothetical protein
MPSQQKVAVIELDKKDKALTKASIFKVGDDGNATKVFSGKINSWGNYYKYNYVKFDFTPVKTPGIYYIQYGNFKTNNFLIEKNVYDKITDATSDIWIPIHMNHMFVNEAYRVWHGEPFKEGYRQAPPNTDHFDLHDQGPTTDTNYKALELIPGLNVGGFFDAGDFDIETGSNISVVVTATNYLRDSWLNTPIRVQKLPVESMVNYYKNALGIQQEEEEASILTLALKDSSPARAEDVLNTLITVYNEEAIKEKNQVAVNTANFINGIQFTYINHLIIVGNKAQNLLRTHNR